MKLLLVLPTVVLLTACGESASTETPPMDTVDSLLANPERLKELRDECRINHSELGDALCNTVAEATRRAFIGDGEVPYTPPEKPPAF